MNSTTRDCPSFSRFLDNARPLRLPRKMLRKRMRRSRLPQPQMARSSLPRQRLALGRNNRSLCQRCLDRRVTLRVSLALPLQVTWHLPVESRHPGIARNRSAQVFPTRKPQVMWRLLREGAIRHPNPSCTTRLTMPNGATSFRGKTAPSIGRSHHPLNRFDLRGVRPQAARMGSPCSIMPLAVSLIEFLPLWHLQAFHLSAKIGLRSQFKRRRPRRRRKADQSPHHPP